jgi:hypothetical protein
VEDGPIFPERTRFGEKALDVEVVLVVTLPEAALAAEIRDSGRSAHARPGQRHRVVGVSERKSDRFDVVGHARPYVDDGVKRGDGSFRANPTDDAFFRWLCEQCA